MQANLEDMSSNNIPLGPSCLVMEAAEVPVVTTCYDWTPICYGTMCERLLYGYD